MRIFCLIAVLPGTLFAFHSNSINDSQRNIAILQDNAVVQSSELEQEKIDPQQISELSISLQMHYMFGPAFEGLKAEIGDAADDDIDWDVVRQHSLIISELASRLNRWPELREFDNAEQRRAYAESWEENEVPNVKQSAHEIYQLAKDKDPSVKQRLVELANNCNICHSKGGSWAPVVIKP